MAHVTLVTGATRGDRARPLKAEAASSPPPLALLEAGFITGSTSSVSRGQYSAARGNGLEKSRR